MYFYTSDLHLNHEKIIEYCNRPFKTVDEMNRVIVTNWNNRVKEEDTVFILGDMGFLTGESANDYLRVLKGKKILVVGNHDRFLRDKKFNKSLLEDTAAIRNIKDPFIHKNIVLCHYPIAVWDRANHGMLHFYGHVHNNTNKNHPILYKLEGAYNVGTDLYNFYPMTAEEIVKANLR